LTFLLGTFSLTFLLGEVVGKAMMPSAQRAAHTGFFAFRWRSRSTIITDAVAAVGMHAGGIHAGHWQQYMCVMCVMCACTFRGMHLDGPKTWQPTSNINKGTRAVRPNTYSPIDLGCMDVWKML
jgi:hypothetical protein